MTPQGEMTIYTAADWKKQLLAFFAQRGELEIDLSAVEEIDSSGLQLLLMVKKEAGVQGRAIRLFNHSRSVLEALNLCGLNNYLGDSMSTPSVGK